MPTGAPGGHSPTDALVEVARLIRELHDAAADFRPTDPVWREHAYAMLPAEIACHSDLGPHNTVYRDGCRSRSSTGTAHDRTSRYSSWGRRRGSTSAHRRRVLRGDGLPETPDRGRRLRLFGDAYGAGGDRLFDAVREAKQREAERPRYWPGMTAAIVAEFLAHVARELDWLARERGRSAARALG